jgi:thiol:disulfide interchange protein DsbC
MTQQFRLDRRTAILRGSVGPASLLIGMPALAEKSKRAELVDTGKLKEIISGLLGKVDDFQAAPVSGWYEVIVRGEVLYIDASGKYLFEGHLVDIASRSSLTASRKTAIEKASLPTMEISKLNLSDAIKTSYGREVPRRLLVTFEDPRCGFCQRLYRTLLTLDDVVVYTFPVSFLGAESRRFNEAIWCSNDRAKAWREAMQGIPPPQLDVPCDFGGLDRNGLLADFYRVQGTPTIFNAKGDRIDGAGNAQILSKALEDGAQL